MYECRKKNSEIIESYGIFLFGDIVVFVNSVRKSL